MDLTLKARRGDHAATKVDGRWRLVSEREWLVRGPPEKVREVHLAAEGWGELLDDGVLLLSFRNAIGRYELPHLGGVELVSGKWGQDDFDAMLTELSEVAAGLPFSGGSGAGLPYARVLADRKDVLLHAFVYLRHVLSEAARPQDQLAPALRRVVESPHHRMEATEREVPVEQARSIGTRGLMRVVEAPWNWAPYQGAGAAAFAQALGGHLPTVVREDHRRRSWDTPENRFVLSFLRLAVGVVEAVRRHVGTASPSMFHRALLEDCSRVERVLDGFLAHSLWQEVGPMVHFPAGSTVLHRRYGYREVFRHFVRLRMVSRLPLGECDLDDLLRLKDIAKLYELWCYFSVASELEAFLGPPRNAAVVEVGAEELAVARGICIEWPDGTRLHYDRSFRGRGRGDYRTTSVTLRPDIALELAEGPHRGLHLFDAKFRLQTLKDFVGEEGEDDPDTGGAATFKRADMYKMHAYRDAIPDAQSVWVLYPGTEQRFFPAVGAEERWEGVGAVPLVPGVASGAPVVGRFFEE